MKSVELFRCLGDATRLTVLEALATEAERCVSDLVAATGKEQTNVSHHLAQLRACGLVMTRRDGKQVLYRLAHPRLKRFLHQATEVADHVTCADPDACRDGACC